MMTLIEEQPGSSRLLNKGGFLQGMYGCLHKIFAGFIGRFKLDYVSLQQEFFRRFGILVCFHSALQDSIGICTVLD